MKYRLNELRQLIREAIINAYEILGVPRNATQDEIHKAHRVLALRYHTDRPENRGDDALKRMVNLNVAKDVLSDPAKRKQLDFQLKHSPNRTNVSSSTSGSTPRQSSGAESVEDFFRRTSVAQPPRQPTPPPSNNSQSSDDPKVELKRNFRFIGGNSRKFWNIEVKSIPKPGATSVRLVWDRVYVVTVNWGRIGTNGQTQKYQKESLTQATRFAREKIYQKLNKGYVDVTPKASAPDDNNPRQTYHPDDFNGVPNPPPPPKSQTRPEDAGPSRKIYGKKGKFDVHTRIKGQVYGKTGSKFSPNDKANVSISGRKLNVTRPSDGHTQKWDREE